MAAVLLDTNLLVYAYVTNPSDSRVKKAKEVFERCATIRNAFVSVQNLAEFSSVCLGEVKPQVPIAEILRALSGIETAFGVVVPSAGTVRTALLAVERHQLSFWDAMIWATAKENGIERVLSEDFSDGRAIEGVRFENPLT